MTLPTLPDAFDWTDEPWGPGLRCRPLAEAAPHVFSTRGLEHATDEGRGWLCTSTEATELVTADQVHGATVLVAERHALSTGQVARPAADVLVSRTPGRAVAVRAADCVPVLLATRDGSAVAAVHAGWRGTAAGAVGAAVAALEREYGAAPADLIAAIGPSIGACCYEVGPELVDAFAAAGHARHLIDRWFPSTPPSRGSQERGSLRLDLVAANRDQLVLAGVAEAAVHVVGLCTAMHLDVLTSFRAERAQAGRLVAAIAPRPLGKDDAARAAV